MATVRISARMFRQLQVTQPHRQAAMLADSAAAAEVSDVRSAGWCVCLPWWLSSSSL